MKNVKLLLIILALHFAMQNMYAEGKYLGLNIGFGDVTVDGGFFPELTLQDDTDGVFISELAFGYEFANQVLIEASVAGLDGPSGTDVTDFRLAAGYVFPSSTKTSIYTKVGIDFWNLEARRTMNGSLVNTNRIAEEDGENLFLQVGLNVAFNETISLNISYDLSNPDYGQSTSGRLGLRWSF